MELLNKHERLEVEVLDHLARGGYFRRIVFGGGTMLRLCHELPRYSVDLDFWFSRKTGYEKFHQNMEIFLSKNYELTDVCNKHYTLLYELRSGLSDRKLKIEIRKEIVQRGVESKIAFSGHASSQVLVQALSLEESARRKKKALLSRNEIRDYFDMEFLLKKGIRMEFSGKEKKEIEKRVILFKKEDYSVSLGSLLDKKLREYYVKNGFSYLLEKLRSF